MSDPNPANPHRNSTRVDNLGGRPRWLVFRSYELALFEEQMGKPILAMLQGGELLSFRAVLNAILVGVAWEWREAAKHKRKIGKLDAERVGQWIDDYPDGFPALATIVAGAITRAIPGGEDAINKAKQANEQEIEDDDSEVLPPFFDTGSTTETSPESTGDAASTTPTGAESQPPLSGGTPPIPPPDTL